MGGRKKTFKALKKPKLYKPKSNFDCGVCGWKDCILIKIKKGIKQAKLECERCETKFQMKIRSLDEPIDVYHDWLHKIKTKSITPYPNRLENDYEDYSDEENCNDVEKYLRPNNKTKSIQRKRIKKNYDDDDEDIEKQSSNSISSQVQQNEEVSEDSLIQKQKFEVKYKKEYDEEEEKQSSEEEDDSKDESFHVKYESQKNRNAKVNKKK